MADGYIGGWGQGPAEATAVLVVAAMWECPTCGHHNLVPQSKILDQIDRCEECMSVTVVTPPAQEVANV